MLMGERKIIVCVKQVPDPEGPPSAFRIDSQGKKVIPEGIPPVVNPFDENALEAALRLKENCGTSNRNSQPPPNRVSARARRSGRLCLARKRISRSLESSRDSF